LLAGELALVAPATAIQDVVPLLASQDTAGRRLLRKALGFALRDRSAAPHAVRWLNDASLPDVATLDLLRALGRRAPELQPAAGRALARLAQPGASFRTRFLVLGPAAALAEHDAGARAILARSLLRDPSKHVRAEAARRVPRVDSFESELTSALRDPAVRVREAAVITLQTRRGSFASRAVAELLLRDRWPVVRSAAAVALARHAADPAVDVALAEALGDASREVRAPAVLALGQRVARAHAEVVRERLEDAEEDIEVRVSAAIALGLMCDTEAVGELTRYALALSDPSASANARVLAPAALGALARIHPADLRKRLDRLLDPKAPLLARRAAEAALAEAPACGRRAGR